MKRESTRATPASRTVARSPRSAGGQSKAGEQTVTKTRQPAREIFGKKRGRMVRNFTETDVQAECVRREQELEDAELLALDGGKFISGSEAALDDLEDVEFCRDLVSKHARGSARMTGEAIADIRDRYETIVVEFLAARYTHADGKRYSLGTVLRGKLESDTALKEFLPKFSKWIGEYVSNCIREHSLGFTPLYRQIVPTHTWTFCSHSVSRELLIALAEEYVRDRVGLMRFLVVVFKRWRKLFAPYSPWCFRLLAQQITGTSNEVAAAMEKIGAAPRNSQSLGPRVRKYRSRDQKAALERRGL
jgi:hypothetical protein